MCQNRSQIYQKKPILYSFQKWIVMPRIIYAERYVYWSIIHRIEKLDTTWISDIREVLSYETDTYVKLILPYMWSNCPVLDCYPAHAVFSQRKQKIYINKRIIVSKGNIWVCLTFTQIERCWKMLTLTVVGLGGGEWNEM